MINRNTFAFAHSEGCMRLLGFLCVTEAGCMLRLCQNPSMPWQQRFWLTGDEKYCNLNVTRQTNLMYQESIEILATSWWHPEIRLRGPH